MSNSHKEATAPTTDIPDLSETPTHHAGCCLSLSTTLLNNLSNLFAAMPNSGPVLSIGSGTGLLEALLNAHLAKTSKVSREIEGVEVRSGSSSGSEIPMNAHLPEELTNTVDGTWAICSRIETAVGLMFVYPREVRLVERYLRLCVLPRSRVNIVVWLGPKADWNDYEGIFTIEGFGEFGIAGVLGLVEYETVAVLKRKAR